LQRAPPNLSCLYRISTASFILSAEAGALRSGSIPRLMTPFRLYATALAVAGSVLATYFLFRRKPKTGEDLERERRAWLDQVGRITDGTVIDVQEVPGTDRKSATVLIYHYDVAGVSYECSQDVTYLRPLINLHSCRLGLPTSVRYDPHNPGNSLVISERWMGLRQ
jgi:hypothetical protein